MPDDATKGIGDFLDYVWERDQGQASIATLSQGESFKQYMIPWPEKRDSIVRFILKQDAAGNDVYFSPNLFEMPADGKPRREREYAKPTRILYADFDNHSAPEDWEVAAKEHGIPVPTLRVQSSVPGNEHAYWKLSEFQQEHDIDWVERKNRAIAARLGADMSGWDGHKLLRVPYTTNNGYRAPLNGEVVRKPWYQGESVPVTILSQTAPVSPAQFESLGTVEREVRDAIELGEIPNAEVALMLGNTTPGIIAHISMTQEEATESSPDKRSGALQKLAYMLAESTFNDEAMFSILGETAKRWDKYNDRSPAGRRKLIIDMIAKARAKIGYLGDDEIAFAGLLGSAPVATEQETKLVYNFSEFLALDIKVNWFLKNLVSEASIGMITGEPGVGKTQLGMNMAMELALGHNFLDYENEVGPVKVLFLELEMHAAGLKYFMEQMGRGQNDHRALSANLNISALGEMLPLDNEKGYKFLDNMLSQFKPDVLFIDSLQTMSTKPLSDEVASRALMESLRKLRVKHNCAMYVVHHNKKKQAGSSNVASLNDLYGSVFISAGLDWALSVQHDTDNPGGILLNETKNRFAAMRQLPLNLERDKNLIFQSAGSTEYSQNLEEGGLML